MVSEFSFSLNDLSLKAGCLFALAAKVVCNDN